MCWWYSKAACAWLIVFFLVGAGSARGEAILKLDRATKAKAAAKSSKKVASPPAAVRDDPEPDPGSRFVFAGKKEQPATLLMSSKKKDTELPPLQWNDKHAGKVQLKVPKVPSKPVHAPPKPKPPVWTVTPTPMAPSAMEVSTVPAPQSFWAGLAMIAAMGAWRWFAGRYRAAQ